MAMCAVVAAVAMAPDVHAQHIAIRGETVYTMAGPAIRDGVVLIRDGKIERVGPAADVAIPAGVKTLTAKIVTPGLIDAHATAGLTGMLNQFQDQDQLEHSEPLQPELRAIDAYNGQDPLIEWIRNFGITTIHTGHAPGEVISGQTMIVKTVGNSVQENVLNPSAMLACTLGERALVHGEKERKSPGTRAKAVALLRSELVRTRTYLRKLKLNDAEKRPDRNLRLETLGRALNGELPLLITVHRAHDILTALRVAKEFKLRIILDGASEAYLVTDQIKAAGVPVIVHPMMARSRGAEENNSFLTPATLLEAGIPMTLQSGYESYVPKTRVLLFETAIAASNGLTFDQALRAITIEAAKILGIDKRVGSIEPGKDADLALYDGDPFEYTTHCTGVVINGKVVSESPH